MAYSRAVVVASEPKEIAAYVPFGGRKNIGCEAMRPRPDYVTLSWCSGRPAQRPLMKEGKPVLDDLTGEVAMEALYYAGFFCDIGEDPELDAALDALGTPKISIKHQEDYGEHWMLQRAAFYLLAEGVQSKNVMRDTTDRLGVAYGWRKNKYGNNESYLYAMVLPYQLVGRYSKPLVLAIKGTQTDDVLKVFSTQFDVLTAAHEILRSQGQDMDLPLWSYAMPAGPAKKTETRGQGAKSSDIFPIISLAPSEIGTSYLQKYEAPTEALDDLLALVEHATIWSSDLVARIAAEQALPPGLGTSDLDEGQRIGESPAASAREQRRADAPRREEPAQEPSPASRVTDQQLASVEMLCKRLQKATPQALGNMTYGAAKELILSLNEEYRQKRAAN